MKKIRWIRIKIGSTFEDVHKVGTNSEIIKHEVEYRGTKVSVEVGESPPQELPAGVESESVWKEPWYQRICRRLTNEKKT